MNHRTFYNASLFVQDETIYFFDSHIDSVDKSYDGTWIGAYGLKWRFYGQKCSIPVIFTQEGEEIDVQQ